MAKMTKPPVYSRPTYAVDYIPSETKDGVFLGSPAFDASVRLNVVLLTDVWAARRRLNIIDSLLAKKITPTAAKVELYVPTAEEEKAWTAERDQLIKDNLGPLIEVAQISPSFLAANHL